MQSKLFIIFGFLFLYLVNLTIVSLALLVFKKFSKRPSQLEGKIVSIASFLSVVVLVVNILSLMLFSFQLIIFAIASSLALFGSIYFFFFYIKKFNKIDALILAGLFVLILNPVWLTLTGVI